MEAYWCFARITTFIINFLSIFVNAIMCRNITDFMSWYLCSIYIFRNRVPHHDAAISLKSILKLIAFGLSLIINLQPEGCIFISQLYYSIFAALKLPF